MDWLGSYKYRKKITIDHTKFSSDLDFFPIPIVLGSSVGQDNQDVSDIFTELGYSFTEDTFTGEDGDEPDKNLWEVYNRSASGTILINSNKLKFTIPSTSSDEIVRVESKFKLSGDFDIQVDYEEISNDAPSSSNSYPAWFGVFTDDGNFCGIFTVYTSAYHYMGYDSTADSLTTNTTLYSSGKFRLVRSGSTITAYYWTGLQWEWEGSTSGHVFSDSDSSDVTSVRIESHADFNSGCVTDWDNFVINSGTPVWDETSHPNRKKIAVTKDDGITQIFGDIEQFDVPNEKAVIWVSKADLSFSSSTDTELYLYYDSDQDSNDQFIGTAGEAIAGTFSGDTFSGDDGDFPDCSIWTPYDDYDTYSQILNNKLNFAASEASFDAQAAYRANFLISGDFDIQFDFDITTLDLTSTSNNYIQLKIFNADAFINFSRIRGITNTGYAFEGTSDSWTSDYTYSGTEGKLRLTRSGSTLTGYYWNGSNWVWNSSTSGKVASTSSSADFHIAIWFKQETGSDMDVNVDNFTITSGTVIWDPHTHVWDDDFVAIYHMNQDPNGDPTDGILDSSRNEHHGTPSGTMTSDDLIDGMIGKAIDFDGTNDLITITGQYFNYDVVTLEAVGYTTYTSDAEKYIASNVQSGGYGLNREYVDPDNKWRWTINLASTYHNIVSDDEPDTSNFEVIAGRYDQIISNLFVDGVLQSDDYSSTTAITDVATAFCIGCNAPSGGNWEGPISEIRLSNVARSDAWLSSTYYAFSDDLIIFEDTEFWYSNNIQITIDHTKFDSDATHFPIPIVLGSSVGISGYDVTDVFDKLVYPYRPESVDDDFTGTDLDTPNSYLWSLTGTQRVPYIKTNRVRFWIAVGSTDVQYLISKYRISGDCDISVDYELISQPTTGVRFTQLFITSIESNSTVVLQRRYESSEKYYTNRSINGTWDTAVSTATSDTTATFRIVRSGTTVSLYADEDLLDTFTWLSEDFLVNLGSQTNVAQSYTADFDNFTVNSGTIVWPELEDTFDGDDGDAPNIDLWSNTSTTSSLMDIQSNQLSIDITSETTSMLCRSKFVLSGDFDIQVDFAHTGLGSTSSIYFGFMITEKDDETDEQIGLDIRYSAGSTYYFSGAKVGGSWDLDSSTTTTDTSGKFRCVRTGSTVYNYYWNSGWTLIDSHTCPDGDLFVHLRLTTTANITFSGTFDNFVVNSGTIVWADNTHPNRKKIAITTGDLYSELYGEIELWDSTNENSVIWVSKSDFVISSTEDTILYLHYDPTKEDNVNYISDTGEWNTVSISGDDFTGTDDDPPDVDLWVSNGTQLNPFISSNALRFDIDNSSLDDQTVKSKFYISGDFDIQVDFDFDTYSSTSTREAGIYAWSSVDSDDIYIFNRRYYSGDGEHYYANEKISGSWGTATKTVTTDFSGKLRLVRSGSTMTAYSWTGSAWSSIRSATGPTTDMRIWIWAKTTVGVQNLIVDFDNFVINSADSVLFSPAQRVWDDDFKAVYHMAQDPNGDVADSIFDSTLNAIHATPTGTMTSDDLVDGPIGKGIEFDGTDDYVFTAEANDVLNITDTLTLEACVLPASHSAIDRGIINRQHIPTGSVDSYVLFLNADDEIQLGTNGGNIQGQAAAYSIVNYNYIAGTFNATGLTGDLYLDGVTETLSTDGYDTMAGGTNSLAIGALVTASSQFFTGKISEIRISNIVRPEYWIKATNYSLTDGILTFATSEEPVVTIQPIIIIIT
jgi:hypothetical protein